MAEARGDARTEGGSYTHSGAGKSGAITPNVPTSKNNNISKNNKNNQPKNNNIKNNNISTNNSNHNNRTKGASTNACTNVTEATVHRHSGGQCTTGTAATAEQVAAGKKGKPPAVAAGGGKRNGSEAGSAVVNPTCPPGKGKARDESVGNRKGMKDLPVRQRQAGEKDLHVADKHVGANDPPAGQKKGNGNGKEKRVVKPTTGTPLSPPPPRITRARSKELEDAAPHATPAGAAGAAHGNMPSQATGPKRKPVAALSGVPTPTAATDDAQPGEGAQGAVQPPADAPEVGLAAAVAAAAAVDVVVGAAGETAAAAALLLPANAHEDLLPEAQADVIIGAVAVQPADAPEVDLLAMETEEEPAAAAVVAGVAAPLMPTVTAATAPQAQPIMQVENTLHEKALCALSHFCWTKQYQQGPNPPKVCPFPKCKDHARTQPFRFTTGLVKHMHSHEYDPDIIDSFAARHKLKICTVCQRVHNEVGADHTQCAIAKSSVDRVYKMMNDTHNDAFLDALDVDVMCELRVPTARKIKGSKVGHDMAAISVVLMEAIKRNEDNAACQSRWWKLYIFMNSWVLSYAGRNEPTTQADRLRMFAEGRLTELHARLLDIIDSMSKKPHSSSSDEKLRQRVIDLAGMGELSRAMRTLTSTTGVAVLDEVNLVAVKKLFMVDDSGEQAPTVEEEAGVMQPHLVAGNHNQQPHPADGEPPAHPDMANQQQPDGAADDHLHHPPDPEPLKVSREMVKKAIHSIQRGTAPGRSGLRLDHLKYMLSVMPTMVNAVTDIVNMAAACKIPTDIASYMFGGAATCFKKETGGLRPVVPQEALARVIGRAIAAQHKLTMRNAFRTAQVAMQPEGMAALATALDANMKLHAADGWVIQALDCSNAYNEIDRVAIRAGLAKLNLQSFLKIHEQIYGQENDILLITAEGKSVRLGVDHGTLQGDPLSGFFYCAGLQPVLEELQAEAREGAEVLAYQDDVYLIGPLEETERLRLLFVEKVKAIGLRVNGAKCVVACSSDDKVLQATAMVEESGCGAKVVSLKDAAVVVLGVPLGDPDAVRAMLAEKNDQLDKDMGRLLWLSNMQTGLLLLSNCAVPRINHLLRTVPPSIIHQYAARHDASIMHTAAKMLEPSVMHDMAKAQARLPISNGGLGLFSAVETSAAAYLAALADTMRVAEMMFPKLAEGIKVYLGQHNIMGDDVRAAIEMFNQKRQQEYEAICEETPEMNGSPAPTPRTMQDALSAPTKEQQRLRRLVLLERMASFKEMMRQNGRIPLYISLQMQGAGSAYTALPSSGDLRMTSQQLRVNTCRRLSMSTELFHKELLSCPHCKKQIDRTDDPLAMDYHVEICMKDGMNSRRHHATQMCLQKIAAALGIPSSISPQVQAAPAELFGDLLFPGLRDDKGRPIVVDNNVTNVNQGDRLSPTNPGLQPLGWSTTTTTKKITKYQAACNSLDLGFSVFSIETTGALGWSAKEFLARLLDNACILPDDAGDASKIHLIQQLLAVSVFQHNGDKLVAASRLAKGLSPFLSYQADEMLPGNHVYYDIHQSQ